MMPVAAPPAAVVWSPNAGPQTALVTCPVRTVFYGGARGGGKSDGLLGDWIGHAGRYGANARGLLIRRTLPELSDLIERSVEILTPLGWEHNVTAHTWRGPDGALLRMRYLDNDKDAQQYQGHSYTWIGVDEVGNFPRAKPIDLLSGTLRSAKGVPCYMRLTGNPGGPGHSWVKERYIAPHPEGFVPFTYEVNGSTVEAVFIPSTLDDNPYLGVEYESQIAQATAGDDALFKAWRYGDWDVFVGQMYQVRRGVHIVPNRKPTEYPAGTEWFATLDWGYIQGAYGLWAPDAERRIELAWEFYEGFRELHAKAAAHAIIEAHDRHGWPLPRLIHADEQMWQKHGSMGVSLGEEFATGLREAVGARPVPDVVQARHRPGSRETKVALIQRGLAVGTDTGPDGLPEPWARPSLTFAERCKHTIRVLQAIPRDPDNPNDVDADFSEDHAHDMVGFAVAARPEPPEVVRPQRVPGIAHTADKYLTPEPRTTGPRIQPRYVRRQFGR